MVVGKLQLEQLLERPLKKVAPKDSQSQAKGQENVVQNCTLFLTVRLEQPIFFLFYK